MSVGFAIRAYIGVLLVQMVVILLMIVLSRALGVDLKEQFKQKLLE